MHAPKFKQGVANSPLSGVIVIRISVKGETYCPLYGAAGVRSGGVTNVRESRGKQS